MKLMVTMTYKGNDNRHEIEELCSLVDQAGFESFCFRRDVEKYQKIFDDPKDLMKRAKDEIAQCDALLIDLTNKPTGRAYEAGMAYCMDKKIVVILEKGTFIKETTKGIADLIIEYEEIGDIVGPLSQFRKSLT